MCFAMNRCQSSEFLRKLLWFSSKLQNSVHRRLDHHTREYNARRFPLPFLPNTCHFALPNHLTSSVSFFIVRFTRAEASLLNFITALFRSLSSPSSSYPKHGNDLHGCCTRCVRANKAWEGSHRESSNDHVSHSPSAS